jgi:hypothetical protein
VKDDRETDAKSNDGRHSQNLGEPRDEQSAQRRVMRWVLAASTKWTPIFEALDSGPDKALQIGRR